MPTAPQTATSTYKTGRTILDICDGWLEEFEAWDEDCAVVSKFYSGAVIESPKDQDVLGLINHKNYQSGRKTIEQAREETLSQITGPQRLMSFKLKDFGDRTPAEKDRHEQIYSQLVDSMIRTKDPVFMDEMKKMVDRHVVHGDALMMFDPDGWRPRACKILTDIDSPQNVHDDNFCRWALMRDLQMSEVLDAIKDDAEGWTGHARKYLTDEWDRVYKKVEDGVYGNEFDRALDMYCSLSPEEWESQGQTGGRLCEFTTRRFKAYYFFQKDFSSGKSAYETPVDLYIVARFKGREDTTGDPLLFKLKGAYPSVREAVYEFVLDSNLGVLDPSWGTIKGLGHLNYTPDVMVNILTSILTNSAIDKATPLWQVVNASDLKMIQKFIKNGFKANQVLPAGINFVDKGKQGVQVGEALNLITFMQAQGVNNATGYTANSAPSSKDELRVQSLNRQRNDQRVASNRATEFARKINFLLQEVGRRIADMLYSTDELCPQMEELKRELLRLGVEIEWFYPENLDISYVRLAGDGDPERRLLISENLLARISLYPDEYRPTILKEYHAALTGNWEEAQQIFGQGDQTSTDAQVLAFTKAATIMELASPLPITAEDLPQISLPVIVATLNAVVGRAEQAGQFEPDKFAGFVALGQYGVMMIQKLESYGQNQLGRTYEGQIQELSRRAQGPYNAMLEAQQAKQQELDQETLLKLQLEDRKVAVQEGKLQNDVQKTQAKGIDASRGRDFQEYQKTKESLRQDDKLELEKIRLQADLTEKQAQLQNVSDATPTSPP